MTTNGKHEWKYSITGGATRVNIASGQDIAHLDELDQKQWTVLSCPVAGLEFDAKSLAFIDTDCDGRIHVNDIIITAKWLTDILKDPDRLLLGEDFLPLEAIDRDQPQADTIYRAAKRILDNLGLKKDSISLADTAGCIAAFAQTRFNGDGIITAGSTDDPALQDIINACISVTGSVTDRSGQPGIDERRITDFYTALRDYAAWQQAGQADKAAIFPLDDGTAAALAALEAVKAKIDDWFLRCKLFAFSADSAGGLDVSAEKIAGISGKNLTECGDEIASFPLARVSAEGVLSLEDGLNPAWAAAIKQMADLLFKGKKTLTDNEWQEAQALFAPYKAWMGAVKGSAVEALGLPAVTDLLAHSREDELKALAAQDKALESEYNAMTEVDKLLHLYRDFYRLLQNFVNFSDFYSRDERRQAIFQAGKLYIDQRCCELCIKVPDMGPHNASASLSGMYLMYCNCVSKKAAANMTIAAVLTDGEVANLREGKHGIFYDRNGLDWDATVIKIIDNPISIRQAFWSPYRKLGKFVEEKIAGAADAKDTKVMNDLMAKIDQPADAKSQPFDIAKYAGIFAALGLAVSAIGAAFAAIIAAVKGLVWWKWLVIIAAVMSVISGPAMIKAWLKLRKRNLAPLLNANGWAMNTKSIVNVRFGATLTSVAQMPKGFKSYDPFADKHSGRNWSIVILLLIAIAVATLFFLGVFGGEPICG